MLKTYFTTLITVHHLKLLEVLQLSADELQRIRNAVRDQIFLGDETTLSDLQNYIFIKLDAKLTQQDRQTSKNRNNGLEHHVD